MYAVIYVFWPRHFNLFKQTPDSIESEIDSDDYMSEEYEENNMISPGNDSSSKKDLVRSP